VVMYEKAVYHNNGNKYRFQHPVVTKDTRCLALSHRLAASIYCLIYVHGQLSHCS
jgi:hypothetical protein